MEHILETERLTLRKFTTADAAFIIELVNSPGWLQFIGDRHVKTTEDAVDYLVKGPIKSYGVNGFGLWLVQTKANETPIGMCGIIKRDSLDHPDIGFAFLPQYTGQGYASEAAQATMAFAQNNLKLETVLGITVPTNKSSIGLLEKVGLKFVKTYHTPEDNEELMLFSRSV